MLHLRIVTQGTTHYLEMDIAQSAQQDLNVQL